MSLTLWVKHGWGKVAQSRSCCCVSLGSCLGAILLLIVDLGAAAEAAGSAYAWKGCYVGGSIGVAGSKSDWAYTNSNVYTATGNTDPQLVAGAHFSERRGVIGSQAGCNLAFSDLGIIGFEGSWQTNPMNSDTNNKFIPFPQDPAFNYHETVTTNILSVYSLAARLGVVFAPDWLLYGKGGYALARIRTSGRLSPDVGGVFDFADARWHNGWTAGGGLEYRLYHNVTVGAEYAYSRFGNANHSGIVTAMDTIGGVMVPASPVNHRVDATVQSVMARINFGVGSVFDGPKPTDRSQAIYVKAAPRFTEAFSSFTTSEAKYSSWDGTRGSNLFAADRGSGYQVYTPTTIGINYDLPSEVKFETRFKGGWVYSKHTTPNQQATYEGPVDSQASFNATILNFDMIRPTLGVALNLPTGNTFLPLNQRLTRMDPDLVEVGSYGVGLNVNPNAGFIIGLNETTAMSVAAGYAWQGAFTKEGINLGLTPTNFLINTFDLRRRIDPGDVFTANGNLTTSFGKSLVLLGSFAFMSESKVTIDGVPSGRAGFRYTSNLTANYRIDERWALSLNGSWSFQEKNQIANMFGALMAEPKNSNSHIVIGSVEPSYQATERLRLSANYSVLYRDANFYDPIEEQFVPRKLKQTLGAAAAYAITPAASISLRGSHSWIHQDNGPLLVTTTLPPPPLFANLPPTMTFGVWQASVVANVRF